MSGKDKPRSSVTEFGDGEPTVYSYTVEGLSEEEKEMARIRSGHQLVDNGHEEHVTLKTLRGYFPGKFRELQKRGL